MQKNHNPMVCHRNGVSFRCPRHVAQTSYLCRSNICCPDGLLLNDFAPKKILNSVVTSE